MNQMESIQTNNVHNFLLFLILYFIDLHKFNLDPSECVQYLTAFFYLGSIAPQHLPLYQFSHENIEFHENGF